MKRTHRAGPDPRRRVPRTVSVIVPSYNYGSVLEGCVQSVLEQQGVDVRVLIIDDCSSDETPNVGGALAAGDSRVEFRRHAVNQGLIATANDGLEWASGDDVVLLSADDVLVPGALRRAAAILDAFPAVGMVYGAAPYWHAGRSFPQTTGTWRGSDIWRGGDWIDVRCRSGHNCISSPEVVVRNSVQRKIGGYAPSCTHASDLNMWLRVAAVADVAYVRGVPQAVYRVHPHSMLRTGYGPLRDLRERWKAFDHFFTGGGALPADADRLRTNVTRALARQALWRASRTIDLSAAPDAEPLDVDELIAFAIEVYPEAPRLREWRGLMLRRRLGAGRSRWFLPFLVTGAAHRARGRAQRLRGARTGV